MFYFNVCDLRDNNREFSGKNVNKDRFIFCLMLYVVCKYKVEIVIFLSILCIKMYSKIWYLMFMCLV